MECTANGKEWIVAGRDRLEKGTWAICQKNGVFVGSETKAKDMAP